MDATQVGHCSRFSMCGRFTLTATPEALNLLFSGGNTGKVIVQV